MSDDKLTERDRRMLLNAPDMTEERLELLIKLAEVEGRKFPGDTYYTQEGGIYKDDYGVNRLGCAPGAVKLDGTKCKSWEWTAWNPIENGAQALALVKKYKVGIGPDFRCSPEEPEAQYTGLWEADIAYPPKAVTQYHEDLNTAICMAVVEAHK